MNKTFNDVFQMAVDQFKCNYMHNNDRELPDEVVRFLMKFQPTLEDFMLNEFGEEVFDRMYNSETQTIQESLEDIKRMLRNQANPYCWNSNAK